MSENSESLLFTRTGIRSAAPEDFYEALTEVFDTQTVSRADEIAKLREQGWGRIGAGKRAQAIAIEKTKELLAAGENVYYESYLNFLIQRNTLRGQVATVSGIYVVALAVRTPISLIEERVTERYRREDGTIPPADDAELQADLRSLRSMANRVQWPNPSETPCYLDGRKSIDDLLDDVEDHVDMLLGY